MYPSVTDSLIHGCCSGAIFLHFPEHMLFDLSAIFFDEAWPANYVDGAMLILQRDEDHALRRTRSLTDCYDAACTRELAVRKPYQHIACDEALFG